MTRITRRFRFAAVLAALALVATACWKPSLTADYTVTVTSNIVYGQGEVDGGGQFDDLLLDLYVPNVPGQDRFPLIVAIHGGGFTGGSKTNGNTVSWATAFAERGYIVASINYRLAGDDPVPSSRVQPLYAAIGGASAPAQQRAAVAAMDDTMTALDFLHARDDVEEWQTVLLGSSAGAITSLYVAYAMDDFGIERPLVAAVISNWGGFSVGSADAFLEEDYGVIYDDPYFYSEGPVFLSHATGDTTVPYSLSQDIADRADEIGRPYEFFTRNTNQHGFNLFTTEFSPGVSVFQAQVNFLDSVLVGVEES